MTDLESSDDPLYERSGRTRRALQTDRARRVRQEWVIFFIVLGVTSAFIWLAFRLFSARPA